MSGTQTPAHVEGSDPSTESAQPAHMEDPDDERRGYDSDLRRADVFHENIRSMSGADHLGMDELSTAQFIAIKTLERLNTIAQRVYNGALSDIANVDKGSGAEGSIPKIKRDAIQKEEKRKLKLRLESDNHKIEDDAAKLHKVLRMMVSWRMALFKEQRKSRQEAETMKNISMIAGWHNNNPRYMPRNFTHSVNIDPQTSLQQVHAPPITQLPTTQPSMTPLMPPITQLPTTQPSMTPLMTHFHMNQYMMPHGIPPNVYGNQYNIQNHRAPVGHGQYYNTGNQLPWEHYHYPGLQNALFFGKVNI